MRIASGTPGLVTPLGKHRVLQSSNLATLSPNLRIDGQ
jgi:hypothetical protein